MNSLSTLLLEGIALLKKSSDSPRIDAEVLMGFVLKKSRAYLYSHPEYQLTPREEKQFTDFINQRAQGHPVAYLTKQRSFWSLELQVSIDTLIPRPETELLVEETLKRFAHQTKLRMLDLGTGTGAIALALAHEHPSWEIHAYDNSEKALMIAKHNATQLHLTHINFGLSNWFESIPQSQFDVIISNPPYIAENDPHLQEGDIRFEPKYALVSGKEGLDDIQIIIKNAKNYLQPGGILMIEHGYQQKEAITQLFQQFHYSEIQHIKDHQGHDRITLGKK